MVLILPLFLAKKKVQGAPKRKRSCRFPQAFCRSKKAVALEAHANQPIARLARDTSNPSAGRVISNVVLFRRIALETDVNWRNSLTESLLTSFFILLIGVSLARVVAKGNEFSIMLSDSEAREFSPEAQKEFEIKKVKNGIWIMLEKEQAKDEAKPVDLVEKKLIEMLAKKPLSDRVEGKFEKFLSQTEQKKLAELLKEGRVVKFKLGEKYRKAVYKLREQVSGERKEVNKHDEKGMQGAKEESIAEQSSEDIQKNGFAFFSNEFAAKEFSNCHYDDMKSKNIMGMKSFDGNFYFLKKYIYEDKSKAILNYLSKKKGVYLSELGNLLKSRMLARAICEFLKEEGLLIEKKKEFYEAL